jgi:hypothetical protein
MSLTVTFLSRASAYGSVSDSKHSLPMFHCDAVVSMYPMAEGGKEGVKFASRADAHVLEGGADGAGDVVAGAEEEEAGPEVAEAGVEVAEALEEEADAGDPRARGAWGRRGGVRAQVPWVEHEHRVQPPGAAAGRVERRIVVHAQPLPEPHHRRRRGSRGLHRRRCGVLRIGEFRRCRGGERVLAVDGRMGGGGLNKAG